MRLVNVGYGNMVSVPRIIAIVAPDAAPIKRMVQDARDGGRVIDATCGHKTKAVLITDSDHIVLSPLLPETVTSRIDERRETEE
ncbi:MAG: DUF370 domain-containing protein [Clostridia bacterium]|nr:DUF370 domain-containing protein [Clostridia bacterium]